MCAFSRQRGQRHNVEKVPNYHIILITVLITVTLPPPSYWLAITLVTRTPSVIVSSLFKNAGFMLLTGKGRGSFFSGGAVLARGAGIGGGGGAFGIVPERVIRARTSDSGSS